MEGVPTIPLAWWMFDVIIFVFLVGVGALIAELILSLRLRGKKTWRVVVLVMAVVSWCVIFYGSFIEPKLLFVAERNVELDVPLVDGSLRAVVLSDIHLGPFKNSHWAEKLVGKINGVDADIVLIAGDTIFSNTEDIEMLESFKTINKPVYFVLGNHDQEFGDLDYIVGKINEWGMTVLRNRHVEFTLPSGDTFNLAGIDDVWYSSNLSYAFEGVDESKFTILLAHNPDVILESPAESADLVIAGHTHGGQVRLPVLGPVPPLPTKLGRRFDRGLFNFGESSLLFITSGVGETGTRARLFNPPVIDVLNIRY